MTLGDRLARLDPRERRLLSALAIIACVLVFAIGPVGLAMLLSGRRAQNERLRTAISEVQQGRDRLRRTEAEKQALTARYKPPAPQLAGFLETLAKQASLEIPESQDRPVAPHGKDFEERSNKLTLRKVDLLTLIKFMEGIEQSGHPVSISQLNLRKRGSEPNSFDVTMVVSAFDIKERPKKPVVEQRGAAGAGGQEE